MNDLEGQLDTARKMIADRDEARRILCVKLDDMEKERDAAYAKGFAEGQRQLKAAQDHSAAWKGI